MNKSKNSLQSELETQSVSTPETEQAEQKVEQSTAAFEHAMEHLEEKVEESARKVAKTIETVRETIHKPKEILDSAVEQTRSMVRQSRDAIVDLVNRTRDLSKSYYKAMNNIQKATRYPTDHPVEFGSAFAGTLLVGALGYFFGRRRSLADQGIKAVPLQVITLKVDEEEMEKSDLAA